MKILYITTISLTMGFFPEHFKMLLDAGHTVEVACNNENGLPDNCKEFGFKVHHIPFSRSPFAKTNLTAYKELKSLARNGGYDIVHTHTPNASIIARLACRGMRKKGLKVFYTAHGFHFYKGAPLLNWLLFYPFEWLCSFFTDKLITINTEDYALAEKRMHARQTHYVKGVGIDLKRFAVPNISKDEKRRELGVPENATVLLSIGELNENKNHETVIKAIKDLDVYYIIAGRGDKKEYLLSLALELGISDRVKLLGYRNDVNELYKTADIYVFPSFREGLSVALMEAMASGIACAVSRIRGNTDLIDENGGALFDPHSVEECKAAVTELINGDRDAFAQYNLSKIKEFSTPKILEKLKEIYNII